MERSLEKIEYDDLRRLYMLAKVDIDSFFKRNDKYVNEYQGKEIIVALGQGGALHYIDGKNGIKDFDVWFFYPKGQFPLPFRRRGKVDYGKSKFGSHPADTGYKGRRIDILMRSDDFFKAGLPIKGLQNYLSYKCSATSNMLSKKAMVGLWPECLLGEVIWPSLK